MKLTGETEKLKAEILGYKKELKITKESIIELKAKRKTEADEYELSKEETEQCIGALEMAINVLTPAGTGEKKGKKSKLVQTMQLQSSLKQVVANERVRNYVSFKDYELVRSFVEHSPALG